MPLRPSPAVDVHLTPDDLHDQLATDARIGFTAAEKWIPATWFYDDAGCELFDRITELDEYYPTRAERSILAANADEIARLARPHTVVELGSGTSEKTTLLLDAFRRAPARCAGSSRSTSASRRSSTRWNASVRATPSASTGWSATSGATSRSCSS